MTETVIKAQAILESMTKLEFEDLEFKEEGDQVRVSYYHNYKFMIDKKDLESIGACKVGKHSLDFSVGEKTARNKLNRLLQKGFEDLKGPNGRRTIYVHRQSWIPLIGTNYFGIIDRDTDILEVKPMTGCNLNCIFCSVDEGPKSRKTNDFLVEEEYLVEEFQRLVALKHHPVEAHIAGQNEPMLYPKLNQLISDFNKTGKVKDISIDTNGVLLTREKIDELVKSGLTRINLSINALDPELAEKLAGTHYNLNHVLDMARYARKKTGLLIAPVMVPGMNEQEMPKLIRLAKELDCIIGIQNYLEYEKGRRVAKQLSWEEFYARLDRWAEEYDTDLRLEKVFHMKKDKVLEKPYRKGEKVDAVVVSPGKYEGEWLCASQGRLITVNGRLKQGAKVKVEIVREKHNIYKARIGSARS